MTQQNWSDDKSIEMWLTAKEEPIGEADRAELNRLIVENPHLRERLILLAQEQSWLMWNGVESELPSSAAQPSAIALRAWHEAPVATGRFRSLHLAPLWTTAGVIALGMLTLFAVSRWTSREPELAKAAPLNWPLQASVLQIESGSATLALPKVGYVVLEGPTVLEMLDPMRARLKQGRIRVRVTEATGYGFVVEYPDGKVTDLGTEFGLNVPPAGSGEARTSLVVFEGAVDLDRSAASKQSSGSVPVERLTRGEGVTFKAGGKLDRIMSIVTGKVATFKRGSDPHADEPDRVILDATDNLRTSDTRMFYEIVPGGFREDALAYVDRPGHEWNGVTEEGLPPHLIGADYIKTFSDDSTRTDIEIKLLLGRPAKLYLFADARLPPPEWLKHGFRKTKDKVGIDLGAWSGRTDLPENGKGAGIGVDHLFNVWVRTVEKPGVVTLGANQVRKNPYMYGIAAVALEPASSVRPAFNDTTSNDLGR